MAFCRYQFMFRTISGKPQNLQRFKKYFTNKPYNWWCSVQEQNSSFSNDFYMSCFALFGIICTILKNVKNTNGRVLLYFSWFAGTGSFNELPNFTFLVFLPRKFISLSKTKIQRTDQNIWRLITFHPVQKLFGLRQEFLKTNFTNALSFVSNLSKFHDFKLCAAFWLFDMILKS